MTDCGPVYNLELTSTVCTRNRKIKFRKEHDTEERGRGESKRNTHYLAICGSQTSSQHYIFMCAIMFRCVCAWVGLRAHRNLSESLPANSSTGLVISPIGLWARRVMGHILSILNQRKTACGLLCIAHTLYVHRGKTSLGLKQTLS